MQKHCGERWCGGERTVMRNATGWVKAAGVVLLAGLAAGLWAAEGAKSETPTEARAVCNKRVDDLKGKTGVKVLVVPVRDVIDLKAMAFLKRALRRQAEFKADLVLLELDTPGGRSDYMEAMGKDLMGLSPTAATVCYIDPYAFSAGVYLSISCDRIYMSPTGTIGAWTPYVIDRATGMPANLPEDVKKKEYSGTAGIFRAVAQKKGYSTELVDAMGDPNADVLEAKIDGKATILTEHELEQRRKAMLEEMKGDEVTKQQEVDKRIERVKEFRKGPLVLTTAEAVTSGLVRGVVADRGALFKELGLTAPVVLEMEENWSEVVFGFLSSPMVSGILFTIGLIAIYMEFHSPGFGVAGVVGILCIGLVLFSNYLVGLADYTDLLIFGLGALLLAVELFVTPGFGVLGILGLFLMVVGIFLGRQLFVLPAPGRIDEIEVFKVNLVVMAISLITFFVSAIILAKLLPGIPVLNRLVLKSTGPGSAEEMVGSAGMDAKVIEVGSVGESLSLLRPSGRARFGDKILDVMTRGEFIEPGQAIEVLETKGNRILVRAARKGDEGRKA